MRKLIYRVVFIYSIIPLWIHIVFVSTFGKLMGVDIIDESKDDPYPNVPTYKIINRMFWRATVLWAVMIPIFLFYLGLLNIYSWHPHFF